MPQILDNTIEKIKDFVGLVREEETSVELSDSNEILIKKLNLRVAEAEGILRPRLFDWQRNLKFFEGKHWQVAGVIIPTYKANIVINKFFSTVRSLVAYETDNKPEPEIEARIDPLAPEAIKVREGAKQTKDALSYRWDTIQVPSTLTEIYYDRYIYADGFGMYFWNVTEDDVDFEQVKPSELLRSPGSTSVEDAEYIIVKKWRSKKWFDENYPDKTKEINFQSYTEIVGMESVMLSPQEKAERENMALVEHYFEDNLWIIKCGKQILEKKENPFWEWRTAREQMEAMIKKFGIVPNGWKPIKNHLTKPEKPIVHFKGYHLGGDFYSKDLVEQVMPIALAISKRKCQIHDNADNANGQWIIDPSIPESEARKVTSEAGLKIRMNPELIRKEPGTPLPVFVREDLDHSERKFDDLMGHHEVSRGAASKKRMTKAETLALRESDITPVRLVVRNSEVAISKILNGWVQLMKLFYDQPHYIRKETTETGEGFILTRDEIPDNLSILIKVGSSLPVSKEARRLEYQGLFARQQLDPLSFFKLMDYPNPEKLAYRYINWITQGIISDNPPKVVSPEVIGGQQGSTRAQGAPGPQAPPRVPASPFQSLTPE